MTRRVAITGLGLVTPMGIGRDALWDGLMEGRTAVRPIEGVDNLEELPATHYGQVVPVDFDEYIDPQETALWSPVSCLTVTAGILAARDAGVDTFAPERTGVILGTGYGCSYDMESLYAVWMKRGSVTVPRMMPNAPASQLAVRFGARGVCFTVSTACSSGAIAAGLGAEKIRAGQLDACITGGIDLVINASIPAAWNALRVLSRRNDPTASRPFAADRDGLVLAEGAAIIVLEEWEAAKARGARIYAELAGVGATNDAVNIVGPDAKGEIEAIHMALDDAGVTTADVGYVNAHGTSTQANDSNESRVLKEVFGKRAHDMPVSSIKGHIGHPMGAAGAIEVATTALALHHQRVPPTLHYVPGDPDCDLDYVTEGARDVKFRHAITNSFGFGGQNSVLLLTANG